MLSLHFFDDYSLFTQCNLSYIWLTLGYIWLSYIWCPSIMLRFFYVDVHKEYWSIDFVLWALFLSWYLDDTGITMWIGTYSLTSFTSSMWFSSSFFFFFFEDFLKDWYWLFYRHLIYFMDSFKMAKMSVLFICYLSSQILCFFLSHFL